MSILVIFVCLSAVVPNRSFGQSPVGNDQLSIRLSTGRIALNEPTLLSGYGAAAKFGLAANDIRSLYDREQWRDLASKIMDVNFGGDASWFLLGKAAEEMRYFDAALVYYEKSIKDSKRKLVGRAWGQVV